MTKNNSRTNLYISVEARAILSALGAAATGKPSMAAGLAELISRTTAGVTSYPVTPSHPKTQYRAYWLHPGQSEENIDDAAAIETQFTKYAYPTRADATAAAVILRFEEARARALADKEGGAVLAEQEQGYSAMIGRSLK